MCQQRIDEAEAHLFACLSAVDIDSNIEVACAIRYNLAKCALLRGNASVGLSWVRQALEMAASGRLQTLSGLAWGLKGAAHHMSGQTDEARAAYEQSIGLLGRPSDATVCDEIRGRLAMLDHVIAPPTDNLFERLLRGAIAHGSDPAEG